MFFMKILLNNINKLLTKLLLEANSIDDLKSLEVKIFGKKGEMTELMKSLKNLSIDEKKEWGPRLNKSKKTMLEDIAMMRKKLELELELKNLELEWIDPTHQAKTRISGNKHPILQFQRELEDIFMRMGFSVSDGPELDNEWFNFDSLNIPSTHPARDMQDTFFVKNTESDTENLVMRTHTSNLQNRVMTNTEPPMRYFIPGKAYRNESLDATHDMTFYQCEGIVIEENVTIANMKHVMDKALNMIFGQTLTTRYRPAYFPFVEPGLELDIWYAPPGKKGAWMEMMGCGMIHPKVMENANIDTTKYNGFAFGFGLTRLAVLRYGMSDIRVFFTNDIRTAKQFESL